MEAEKETIEANSLDSFSLITEEERPKTTAQTWEALEPSEQEARITAAAADFPAMRGFRNILETMARERFAEERGQKPPVTAATARPTVFPAPSQGKPKRAPRSPVKPSPDAARTRWAEQLIGDAIRLKASHVTRYDAGRPVDALATSFTQLFNDTDNQPTYRARLWELVEGTLPVDCFRDAVLTAISPAARNPGALFSHFIRTNLAYYRESEKAGDRHTRQSFTAAGPR